MQRASPGAAKLAAPAPRRPGQCASWCEQHAAGWAKKCSTFVSCRACKACVVEAESYVHLARAKIMMLAKTCAEQPGAWDATLTTPNVHAISEGVVAINVAVKGAGRARITLHAAPTDSWAERKATLLDVTPRAVLPRCVQDLFSEAASVGDASTPELPVCAMTGGRTLRSKLAAPWDGKGENCMRPVLEDVASASLGFVATWSLAGLAARVGFRELHALSSMLNARQSTIGRVRGVLFGKGSRCNNADRMPLSQQVALGHAHCIEGPNTGARESHTIWSFCFEFYHHLPRTVLFVQDDPHLGTIMRDLGEPAWPSRLEASYASRIPPERGHGATWMAPSEPWRPSPCFCAPVKESLSASHPYRRSITWWARTFLAPYNISSTSMPSQILWPATAQFALPRIAISDRSKDMYALQVWLTEVPAPLRKNVERRRGVSEAEHAVTARNANFGPIMVDLGSGKANKRTTDQLESMSGMSFAQLFERLWFMAFDPATPTGRPSHAECFKRDALARSPVRCAGSACPGVAQDGGCEVTDEAGTTHAPPRWPYSPLARRRAWLQNSNANPRCVSDSSCRVSSTYGSAAWVQQAVQI